MKRLHYLDNLMLFLSILVILHHVSIGYGTMGGWCYVTPEKLTGPVQVILSALTGIEASFSMGLFFFISAYLTIPSLEKKGARKFIKARSIRLLIPLLFVMTIFSPSVSYYAELHNNSTTLSPFNYVLKQNLSSPNTSHTWFILALIVFEFFYVIYWKYIRPNYSISKQFSNSTPNHNNIFSVIILCFFFTIVLRQFYPLGRHFIGLEIANFVPYIFMYSLGILVYRKQWLDTLPKKIAKTWFFLSLISAIYFCIVIYAITKNPSAAEKYITGLNRYSASLSLIQTLICIGFCGFLLNFFKDFFNSTNYILSKMRKNRYGVYIFHSAVVAGVTIALEFLSINIYYKFFIACVLSIVLSFIIVALIRNIPFIKRVI
ncbi:MAG: acyltransferase family protein [Spirosomataceae bacterium]